MKSSPPYSAQRHEIGQAVAIEEDGIIMLFRNVFECYGTSVSFISSFQMIRHKPVAVRYCKSL